MRAQSAFEPDSYDELARDGIEALNEFRRLIYPKPFRKIAKCLSQNLSRPPPIRGDTVYGALRSSPLPLLSPWFHTRQRATRAFAFYGLRPSSTLVSETFARLCLSVSLSDIVK